MNCKILILSIVSIHIMANIIFGVTSNQNQESSMCTLNSLMSYTNAVVIYSMR